MWRTVVLFIFCATVVTGSPIEVPLKCDFKTRCHPVNHNKVTIHIVAHSHDDVGWLKTVDQYYKGERNEIQRASVRNIITTSLEALKKNEDRRYIQVETAYFWKWWQEQTNEVREEYKKRVDNGQLEIINGAWSMNDEATTHYQSIIDQYTWGFRRISDTLGSCGVPKVGWQIDPFGHSREHVSILSQLGFYGLFINRIDYRDKKTRMTNKNMDFLWQSSANLENSTMFTSMFPDFYTTPKGFCFDSECSDRISTSNSASKKNQFKNLIKEFKNYFQTKNVLVPMGGDFHFQKAETNFENLDKLIDLFKDDDEFELIYSTPSCYIKAVNDESTKDNIQYCTKTDDFFPYATNKHEMWTGYYTSRPNSKRNERMANNILQATKQLTSFSKMRNKNYDVNLNLLREAMGIMQHHDAITGTEKQHVSQDYTKIVFEGIHKAQEPLGKIIRNLLQKDENQKNINLELQFCLLSNVSICDTSKWNDFVVAAYNPLSRPITNYVRLPVEEGSFIVKGPDGEKKVDIVNVLSNFDKAVRKTMYTPSTKELVFAAENLPPLGLKLYFVHKEEGTSENNCNSECDYVFGTQATGFEIDTETNLLKSVTMNGITLPVKQEFLFYRSKTEWRPSGAYQFVPAGEAEPLCFLNVTIKSFAKGNLVDEVHQVFNDHVTQIIRVYKDDINNYIEFDWLVGPLTGNDGNQGKEVITRFTIGNFDSEGYFYTDSNGREMIKRKRDYRQGFDYNSADEPISGNYYPVTSKISIRDERQKLEVAVLNDRAQGGSSLKNNEIELMVHRRVYRDDGWGVGEPLAENEIDGNGVVVRGKHFLVFGSTDASDGESVVVQERHLAEEILLQPLVLVGSGETLPIEDIQSQVALEYNGLMKTLPANIRIMTLEPWKDDTYILRLEHILEATDDESSKPVSVNLQDFLTMYDIEEITETTLGANELLEEHNKEERFEWLSNEACLDKLAIPDFTNIAEDDGLSITLKPMQIRTFIIKLQKQNPVRIGRSKIHIPRTSNKSHKVLRSSEPPVQNSPANVRNNVMVEVRNDCYNKPNGSGLPAPLYILVVIAGFFGILIGKSNLMKFR